MAMTLVEAAKLNPDLIAQGVIETFAERSNILAALPFETISSGSVTYNREGALPGVAFRGINESYTESTGIINPVTDNTVPCGGDIDADLFILRTQGDGVMAAQVSMKVKALADLWAQKFIKGDSTSNPREFDGLQVRLVGSQLIDAGSTSGGDALSLGKLDEVLDAVDNPTAIITNKAMRRRLTAAARSTSVGGYITYSVDAFGRRVTMYNDLPILVTESGSTDPLTFTESGSGGGSAVCTSIYVVNMTPGYLTGIQNSAIETRDLGELQTGAVARRMRVEWYAGLTIPHPRAAARLRGITNAAVVA